MAALEEEEKALREIMERRRAELARQTAETQGTEITEITEEGEESSVSHSVPAPSGACQTGESADSALDESASGEAREGMADERREMSAAQKGKSIQILGSIVI